LEHVRVTDGAFGTLAEHENEATRVRYLDGLINKVLILFEKVIVNKPEQRLISGVTKDGAIEYQFTAFSSIIVLFIEVKQVNLLGKNLCRAIAQVMAESDGQYNTLILKVILI
jgi:hypothetical protein